MYLMFLSQISRYGIISVGMALVMITGGIDLSVGYRGRFKCYYGSSYDHNYATFHGLWY